MLNENKIKMMTKMAIYEKNEGKSMLKDSQSISRATTLLLEYLKTVIATTFAG